MTNNRDSEENSETAAAGREHSGAKQVPSEAERQLEIGKAIMQEYRSTLSALARSEQEPEQDKP